ncbi:MAG TPA: hypothetical protein DFK15_02620 [Butyricimonas sp.]|uniref:Uncharacterized protein n=1 Tax=Butyricimonas virosa TaxID=544645 RepID=A0A415QP26_9BACT|nr:hypothetical protein DWZ68_04160 [Butyricimonas virosa]HAM82529.1 hypothetical protein [Butyricimonas sp.]HCH88166.1 hypothetical protein [Butyricimonas sp.]
MFFMQPSPRFIFLDSQIKPDKPTCRIGHKDTALIENQKSKIKFYYSFQPIMLLQISYLLS